MFVRNSWYVAAWDHEIGEALMARTILGEPVVLFRAGDGAVAALADRCCHRHAPLSEGKLLGDEVQCGYHGLRFDRTGQCVHVPSQSRVPPDASIRCYPVVERHRWVWIWMGDPALADAALIPDLFWHDDPCWKPIGDRFAVGCAYQAMIDIQLDQTHSAYVHPSTLGSDDKVRAVPKISRGASTLRCERLMPDSAPPPLWAEVAGITGNADCWNIWTYRPPSIVTFDIGIAKPGTGALDGDRSQGVTGHNSHAVTPETETTCHHFWVAARNFAIDDEALTKKLSGIRTVFLEDRAMCEAQQRTIAAYPGAPSIDLNSDKPTLEARRMVERQIEAERAPD